jgi:hypothetical protein
MRGRGLLLCVALSAELLGQSCAWAQSSLEYQVKAAYLTKFVPFIDWPDGTFASQGAPVTLCVLGADPFGATLDKAAATAGRGSRPLTVRRVAITDSMDGCQIVFTGEIQSDVLDGLRDKPVVTVTDSGVDAKGIISFMVLDGHVRFDIDNAAAEKNGLHISSKLLELAHAVTRRSGAP